MAAVVMGRGNGLGGRRKSSDAERRGNETQESHSREGRIQSQRYDGVPCLRAPPQTATSVGTKICAAKWRRKLEVHPSRQNHNWCDPSKGTSVAKVGATAPTGWGQIERQGFWPPDQCEVDGGATKERDWSGGVGEGDGDGWKPMEDWRGGRYEGGNQNHHQSRHIWRRLEPHADAYPDGSELKPSVRRRDRFQAAQSSRNRWITLEDLFISFRPQHR